jgi:hypothetical protein
MQRFRPLLLCALLSACGGGSEDAPNTGTSPQPPVALPAPAPAPVPAPTLTLSSPTLRTLPGGPAIPLTAQLSSSATVNWTLAAGAPGTLSAQSGNSVRYLPPSGGLSAPTPVTITASGDGASATLTLAITPEPGAPGLYNVAWRTSTEPTMLRPVSIATDLAGNIYAMLEVATTPSRKGPPELVKIAPDGVITPLIGDTWFGQPANRENARRIYFIAGFAVDRAGNLYIATTPLGSGIKLGEQSSAGPNIVKITPTGVLSELAGGIGEQIGAMTDGAGSAARFLNPRIVGIDYDDNVYLLDENDTPRKVTPGGVVTTLKALPAGLNADLNGNTYSNDPTTLKLTRTNPAGVTTPVPGVPYCVDGVPALPLACLNESAHRFHPTGAASYVLLDQYGAIRRLVLQR